MSEEVEDGPEYDYYIEQLRRDRRMYVCKEVRELTNTIDTLEHEVVRSFRLSEECSRRFSRVEEPPYVPVAFGCMKRHFGKDVQKALKNATELLQSLNNLQTSGIVRNSGLTKKYKMEFERLKVTTGELFKRAERIKVYCTEAEEEFYCLFLDELCTTMNDSTFDNCWTMKGDVNDYSAEPFLHLAAMLRNVDCEVKLARACGVHIRQWINLGEGDKDVLSSGFLLADEIDRLCNQIAVQRIAMMNQRSLILKRLNVETHVILINLRKFDIVTGLVFRCIINSLADVCFRVVRYTFDYIYP